MAMYHVVAVLAMLSPVQSFNMEVAMTSSLTFDAEAAKNRPVSKVITLLKDMLKQLEKEAEEDEDIYDLIKLIDWLVFWLIRTINQLVILT